MLGWFISFSEFTEFSERSAPFGKNSNVMHFARLVKQASVDLVSDPFGLWVVCYGAQSPDATMSFKF